MHSRKQLQTRTMPGFFVCGVALARVRRPLNQTAEAQLDPNLCLQSLHLQRCKVKVKPMNLTQKSQPVLAAHPPPVTRRSECARQFAQVSCRECQAGAVLSMPRAFDLIVAAGSAVCGFQSRRLGYRSVQTTTEQSIQLHFVTIMFFSFCFGSEHVFLHRLGRFMLLALLKWRHPSCCAAVWALCVRHSLITHLRSKAKE